MASSLLLERHKEGIKGGERDKDSDRENLQGDKDTGRRPSARTEKIHNWARKRFKNRSKFLYPNFCRCLLSKCDCSRKGKATKERLYFAEEKLRKELDVARFINQQRETYISYLSTMTTPQQVVCQKLAQITYDDSMSSQISSDDDNTHHAWGATDERNIELLFSDN